MYIPGWREALRIKCLSQEHNAVTPGRAQTGTARSRDERTSKPLGHCASYHQNSLQMNLALRLEVNYLLVMVSCFMLQEYLALFHHSL